MKKVILNFLSQEPDQLSGISIYALRIMENLIRRAKHEYYIVTNWREDGLKAHMDVRNARILPGRGQKSEILHFPLSTWQIMQAAKRVDADAVFTPWPFAPAFGGKRRMSVVHDLYRVTHPDLFPLRRKLVWSLYFPFSARHSDVIVCVSETTRADLVAHYPWTEAKACTVHEASTIRTPPREVPPRDGPYGLLVSTAVSTKNLARLIEAVALLEQRQTTVPPIVWIGDDQDGSVQAILRRHGNPAGFIPIGRQDEETLATYYAHAAFYIAPSLTEGFCLPIIEAQSAGVPVLCSDIPIFREVAGEGALYFDPYSAQAIAHAIVELSSNPGLQETLAAAARKNAARFSWDDAAAKIEALL